MNAKTCKKLRREAKFRLDTPTNYVQKLVKERKIFHPPINDFIVVPAYQTVLSNCTRKIYKQLKKGHSHHV